MIRSVSLILIFFLSVSSHTFSLATTNALQRGWQQTTLPLNINSTNCPASVPLVEIIDGAIAPWNTVTASNFILYRGLPSSSTASNLIAGPVVDTPVIVCDTSFQTHTGMDANTVSVYAQVTLSGNSIIHGYVLLNAQAGSAANIANIAPERLKILLGHELGHIVGLGQSVDSGALMYYDLSSRRSTALGQDDIDGVTYLYQRNEPPDGVLGCGLVKNVDTDAGTSAMILLLIPVVFLFLLKIRKLNHFANRVCFNLRLRLFTRDFT
jgi:hypothetical protein